MAEYVPRGAPSDEALMAYYARLEQLDVMCQPWGYYLSAFQAAHDPDLGLDRSVCLRDVIAHLRQTGLQDADAAAGILEGDFSEGAWE